MAPALLLLHVHCSGCKEMIEKALENVPGVELFSAFPEENLVMVEGSPGADEAELTARLQTKLGNSVVDIVPYVMDEGQGALVPAYGVEALAQAHRASSPAPAPPSSPPHYWLPTFAPDYPAPSYYDPLTYFSYENPYAC